MNVTGTWYGEYTYGATYGDRQGNSVPFVMSLTERGLPLFSRRRVVGYVRDDARRGGMPEVGRVLGSRRQLRLTFRKTMPLCYFNDGQGKLVSERDLLTQYGYADLPQQLPPHVIHYSGQLDAGSESIRGTWRIESRAVPTDQGMIELGAGGSGTWTAKRRSPLPSEI